MRRKSVRREGQHRYSTRLRSRGNCDVFCDEEEESAVRNLPVEGLDVIPLRSLKIVADDDGSGEEHKIDNIGNADSGQASDDSHSGDERQCAQDEDSDGCDSEGDEYAKSGEEIQNREEAADSQNNEDIECAEAIVDNNEQVDEDRVSEDSECSRPTGSGQIKFRDHNHKTRYDILKNRELKASRLCCRDSLHSLGILDNVDAYLDKVGWKTIAYLPNISYTDLILEFLSSLNVDPQYTLSFQMLNRPFTLTCQSFATMFGFHVEGHDKIPPAYQKHIFWKELGGQGLFKAGRFHSSEITDKALQYIHRFMTFSVEARGSLNQTINKNELFFLWCMVKGEKVQTGKFFLDHLVLIARRHSGNIIVGAFIRHLANQLKLFGQDTYDPQTEKDSTEKNLNIAYLIGIDMIKENESGGYEFADASGENVKNKVEPGCRGRKQARNCTSTKKRKRVPTSAADGEEHEWSGAQLSSFLKSMDSRLCSLEKSVTEKLDNFDSILTEMCKKLDELISASDY